MTVWWMLYLVLASAPVALATWIVAGSLRRRNRPERAVWALGLLLALALPAGLLWVGMNEAPAGPIVTDAMEATASRGIGLAGIPRFDALPFADSVHLSVHLLWGLGSLLMAGWLTLSLAALRRVRLETREGLLLGRRVRVSHESGPAVIGVVRPEILVPEWVLRLDTDEARWIVRHEEQHILAGDPALLLLAHAARVVLPWNPFVWFLSGRLLEAVEIDCDRRVLETAPDPAAYGRALVDAAVRQPHPLVHFAHAFSLHSSDLERRIQTMILPQRSLGFRGALATALGLVLTVAACAVPMPTNLNTNAVVPTEAADAPADGTTADAVAAPERADAPVESGDPVLDDESGAVFTPYTDAPTIRNTAEVVATLEAEYPPLLRDAGIGGTARLYFFIDEEGVLQDIRVHESSGHEEIDRAAIRVARTMEFHPARNGEEPVAVWLSLPVSFQVRR